MDFSLSNQSSLWLLSKMRDEPHRKTQASPESGGCVAVDRHIPVVHRRRKSPNNPENSWNLQIRDPYPPKLESELDFYEKPLLNPKFTTLNRDPKCPKNPFFIAIPSTFSSSGWILTPWSEYRKPTTSKTSWNAKKQNPKLLELCLSNGFFSFFDREGLG